ncbi:MAG: hypothetical protein JXA57_19110 [Armatimonadetes bacterium]|nr:hypothetical protein [Armatimonadota bacterium]
MRFSDIDAAPTGPGVYEIRLLDGTPLKVGIAANLRKRLRQHRASRDSGLKWNDAGVRESPGDVLSKQSILAKHLYFDHEIGSGFDLQTEVGRQAFLEDRCDVSFQATATRAEARLIEIERETLGGYRYIGRVRVRP